MSSFKETFTRKTPVLNLHNYRQYFFRAILSAMNLTQNMTEDCRRILMNCTCRVHAFKQNPVFKEWEPILFTLSVRDLDPAKTHVLNI